MGVHPIAARRHAGCACWDSIFSRGVRKGVPRQPADLAPLARSVKHPPDSLMLVSAAALFLLLFSAVPTADAETSLRPWGSNAVRVQFCTGKCSDIHPGALEGQAPPSALTSNIACSVDASAQGAAARLVTCSRVDDGKVILRQTALTLPNANGTGGGSATFDFSMSANTVYGMGQNRPVRSPHTCL